MQFLTCQVERGVKQRFADRQGLAEWRGEPPHQFTALPCQAGWKSLDWLGFISYDDPSTVFYLDNVAIRNRPQAGKPGGL